MKGTFELASTITTLAKGFTLVEILLTLTVAAILVAVAVPSFDGSIKNNKLNSAATGLLSEIVFARSEAVKRNLPVSICASTNGTACNTNDWELGRLVFVDDGAGDSANSANGEVDSETILKSYNNVISGVAIDATVFTANDHITFFGDGSVEEVGTMVLCDSRGEDDSSFAKAINVTAIGQARLAYDSDETTDGVVNNVSGANVACI